MWSYLRSQRSKQTNFVDLQFLSNYALFLKILGQKVVRKGTSNMKVYYIIPLNYRLTGNPVQNQTILFSRKIKSSP